MEIRVTSVFAHVGESPFFTATGAAVRRAGARRYRVRRYRVRRYRARRYRARRYRARRRCGRDSFTALPGTRRCGALSNAWPPRKRVSARRAERSALERVAPAKASVGPEGRTERSRTRGPRESECRPGGPRRSALERVAPAKASVRPEAATERSRTRGSRESECAAGGRYGALKLFAAGGPNGALKLFAARRAERSAQTIRGPEGRTERSNYCPCANEYPLSPSNRRSSS